MKVVSGQPSDYRGHDVCNSNSSSVDVTAEWAQYLNLQIQAINKLFTHACRARRYATFRWEDGSGFVQGVVKSIPNTTVANGISRTVSSATIQTELSKRPNNDCNEECGL